ncbi:MAG: efflux RND transporter permease subunit [Candidatus Krumholzibacteriota bacterium]|nr:efflux RND transporter permease subunit [Candidatus Krumholzibacteriota bacterium]
MGELTRSGSPLSRFLGFWLEQKVLVGVLVLLAVGGGLLTAPFDWDLGGLPRDPVPVDAIPDIGENQQIVFTEWPGRSPRDVEDQVTYPLTTSLLGLAGVRTVRSSSMFGLSSVYVIFEDGVDFYWARSRLLEKLASLPPGTLPEDARPALGPDATALGQVFWYTLEGRDAAGRPAGGWSLDELRAVQDFQVRYSLAGVHGVAEVASVGGYLREYQVDLDPDALRAWGVDLDAVLRAVRESNVEVGARTVEVNRVEYLVRGVGFLRGAADLERSVIKSVGGVPVTLGQVASVALGPAPRRGALDREGAEAVGGVVVVRHGANPLAAIEAVTARIAEIAPGLPRKILPDGTESRVTIVPFYDRSGLIHETLDTLGTALLSEILVTILVVLVMVRHLRSSLLIAGLLPLAVLMSFVAMRWFGVDANIVALSGIAIAIGTMVDMGIVVSENVLARLRESPDEPPARVVHRAAGEVGGAVLTAVATTVIGFLPVFSLTGPEGKLFGPLAWTKTFALVAAVLVALVAMPAAAQLLLARRRRTARRPPRGFLARYGLLAAVAALAGLVLAAHWLPLGPDRELGGNALFVAIALGGLLGGLALLQRAYPRLLAWCLDHKRAFLALPAALVLMSLLIWQGFDAFFGWLPRPVRTSPPAAAVAHAFPGLGEEFMPPLDEGSFLLMPTTMPHASFTEALDVLSKQDRALGALPEVESVVGKIGRAESALDPAPVSMIETVINYRSEWLRDERGRSLRFRHDAAGEDLARDEAGRPLAAPDGEPYAVRGRFPRDEAGRLIPDRRGRSFRLWRPPLDPALNPGREAWAGIRAPDDIWRAIAAAAELPGTTGAPRLQPIAARLVMLQSGLRAPMGLVVRGPDLAALERAARELEALMREVPRVDPATVFADRVVGKPYLEVVVDREAAARLGLTVGRVQEVLAVAAGGRQVATTVEGRERYSVRVRYQRELRDSPEALARVRVPLPGGGEVPLDRVAELRYRRGPQVIKGEDGFLAAYVLFDGRPGWSEGEVVAQAREALAARVANGDWTPPAGVSYRFAGSFENQVRAARTLVVVVPAALLVIFTLLYLQFRSATTSALVFSGVAVAWAGGFLLLWLYGQPWFLDLSVAGTSLRELFQMGPVNLSVAVWVGFLALFGIATDDGVIMATYLEQVFARERPASRAAVRRAVIAGARRRIRPALMTAATTLLALLPVLTATGRGADIMVPMAIPSFGGMLVALITVFTVPTLYSAVRERRLAREIGRR